MRPVITRFAPSPTGFLHIGGARTALFNFLYARHCGGRYLLRIEDTDVRRSTPEAIAAILQGLHWLDLSADAPPIYQSHNRERHRQVATSLLASGHAYYCYCTAEELQARRAASKNQGYDRRCRDLPPSRASRFGVPAAVRIKAPLCQDGKAAAAHISDKVQGEVSLPAGVLDDFIILRQDATPTYMLAVVVDDHDMQISHVIRGDDHLMNAFRQKIIYDCCGWECPSFAHIPLIHGADGKKLSKRHAALSVSDYRDMGYLPQALSNYILRLGWGHADIEIVQREEAIALFDIGDIGRGAAHFDFAKLSALNSHYLQNMSDADLLALLADFMPDFDEFKADLLARALGSLKMRAKTLQELVKSAEFYWCAPSYPLSVDMPQAMPRVLGAVIEALQFCQDWQKDNLKSLLNTSLSNTSLSNIGAEEEALKPKDIMPIVRLALSGQLSSPAGVAEILWILGKEESLSRLVSALAYCKESADA